MQNGRLYTKTIVLNERAEETLFMSLFAKTAKNGILARLVLW